MCEHTFVCGTVHMDEKSSADGGENISKSGDTPWQRNSMIKKKKRTWERERRGTLGLHRVVSRRLLSQGEIAYSPSVVLSTSGIYPLGEKNENKKGKERREPQPRTTNIQSWGERREQQMVLPPDSKLRSMNLKNHRVSCLFYSMAHADLLGLSCSKNQLSLPRSRAPRYEGHGFSKFNVS